MLDLDKFKKDAEEWTEKGRDHIYVGIGEYRHSKSGEKYIQIDGHFSEEEFLEFAKFIKEQTEPKEG